MGNFAEARDYGEQALDAAKEAADEVWQLNSSVLIAQADGMFHCTIYLFKFCMVLKNSTFVTFETDTGETIPVNSYWEGYVSSRVHCPPPKG